MKYIGIAKDSPKFKGNLHSHTQNSDGMLTPAQAKEYYKSHGYSFMAFTDHEVYSDYREELNDASFIIIPGIEASASLVADLDGFTGGFKGKCLKTHHVLGLLGTKEMQEKATKPPFKHLERYTPSVYQKQWDGLACAQKLVDDMHERGLAVTYNHPLWSRVDLEEFTQLKNIFAVEIYNYGTIIECGLGDGALQWDIMLQKNNRVHGIACDDNHNLEKLPDSFGGAIVVCADSLSHDAIIQGMLEGNFYSTSGVDIEEWGIDGKTVSITCSPVQSINFIVGGNVGDGETIFCQDREDTITTASYTLKGSESYVRIECVDKYGRKAWTNPYFINK